MTGLMTTLHAVWSHPLNQSGRWAAIGRFLRWQVGARVLGAPVALPFIDDLRLLAEPGMHAATGNYYFGLQEAEDMAFLLHFLRGEDAFHDVGANIGTFSLVAAAAGVRAVHAYEPAPRAREWLARNTALNGLADRVDIHPVAVSDVDGWVGFTEGLDIANHVTGQAAPDDSQAVRCVRLDSVIDGSTPFFLKIDVEGHELEVLAGADALLASPNLLGVLAERNALDPDGRAAGDPFPRLLASGLRPCRYDPIRRDLITLGDVPAKRGGNVLFLRDPERARQRVRTSPVFRLVNITI